MSRIDGSAVKQELLTLWVGGVDGMEADLVKRAGVAFRAIPAAGVHGVGLQALPGNLWRLSRGYLEASRVLREFRPQVLLFTGGYVAVPLALAARFGLRAGKRPRSLVYMPDIEPGLALKTLLRFADQVAVTTEASRAFIPGRAKVTVSGYPVRSDLKPMSKAQGRSMLKLQSDLPTLLVLGGSKGARTINRALMAVLPQLLAEMQVVHISGQLDWAEVSANRQKLTTGQSERYLHSPYLHEEMAAALAAADLVVSRAGASTLGEYPLFGLPAVLVPYPYAWRYQRTNADYLVEREAAVLLKDEELSQRLLPVVQEIMHADDRRKHMGQAMLSLAQPEAAGKIAEIVRDLATKAAREGRPQWSA
jgi:UDP-N-acetylglucosamine--N-acetylmuramyl-(pentapeptide) pyrophosphoryl-undecaprenol N-acetylglucosamine transferase